jgi:hypothetical protein
LLLETNKTECPTKLTSIPGIGAVIICIGLTTELPVLASNSEVSSYKSSILILLLALGSGRFLSCSSVRTSFHLSGTNSVRPLNLGLFIWIS